jgi:ABC-type bacteriocin/lantibiotic exporter with double-glycine peptidase domain
MDFDKNKQPIDNKSILEKINPVLRFWRYVKSEKKDIWIIYIYAIIVGLIGLSLPLGIQAVIQMISGGILYDTAIIIIILVLIGVAITGGLQIMQIYMVEILQRRLFAKATFDFAYRLPRIKADELIGSYPPEIVNRFFDVVLLQKGISKILIELTTAILQVFFGLLLLAIYHPSFIIFDIIFITLAYIVFRVTGKKGLETSLKESSYKYKMISWLQDIARNINTFKMNGSDSNLAQQKTDDYTVKYLKARKSHFKVLISQYINILFFKISIIAATLILGSLLVVEREINLGQFVATEIIIVLILSAIEKLIISVDTVYDAFTSAEKIAKITDYHLEVSGNIKTEDYITNAGYQITVKELCYRSMFSDTILKDVNLTIPAGSQVVLAGNNGFAIEALINIVSGIYTNYNGIVEVNNIAIKNVDLNNYRGLIAHSLPTDTFFEGTILENLVVGNTKIPEIEVVKTLSKLGIYEDIAKLPDGLYSKILPGGMGLPIELSSKIHLARNVLKKPRLWVVHEHLYNDLEIAKNLFKDILNSTSFLIISNNVLVHKKASVIYLLEGGKITASGNFDTLQNNETYKKIINPIHNA